MNTKALLICIALPLLVSCGNETKNSVPYDLGLEDEFVSDVIGVKTKHLSPEYWIKPGMDRELLSAEEIQKFNVKNTASDPTLYDVEAQQDTLSKEELLQFIRSVSKVPKYKRIYTDGTPVNDADFARYENMLNLDTVTNNNHVRFALATQRTSIRTYPTEDLLFSDGAKDRDIERFQESALFTGDAVAVLHESSDGNWALIQSYNYIAWVPLSAIAIGTRAQVFGYSQTDRFLVVTGDKVETVFNPVAPQVSMLRLDMGTKIPLSRPDNLKHNLYGQNPYLSHMVILPIRTESGALDFKHALIQRKEDVHVGYLPFTQENIIKQSFKFLGERYGWGHRFEGRDCTGFVSEVYKSFGIKLPRNSGDQGQSDIGKNSRYDRSAPLSEKVNRLARGQAGDLIYIPGHVLMLLGHDDGKPYVIHDVHGMGYLKDDGSMYSGTLNGVSITPLLPLRTTPEQSYLERATTIKSIQ